MDLAVPVTLPQWPLAVPNRYWQVEAGRKAEGVTREVGGSKHTLYAWKAKYGGMEVNQAQEAKQLSDEPMRTRGCGS
jgi:hypothetical protein